MPNDAQPEVRAKPRHFNIRVKLARMVVRAIPLGSDWRANRYDTDDEMVLHLHKPNGDSYDVRVPKGPNDA